MEQWSDQHKVDFLKNVNVIWLDCTLKILPVLKTKTFFSNLADVFQNLKYWYINQFDTRD